MTTKLNGNLFIQRHAGGIKLIQPNVAKISRFASTHQSLKLSDLFNLPFHIYIENKQNVIIDLNDSCAALYGHQSKHLVIGSNLTKISSLDKRRFNNRQIMRSAAYGVFHEVISSDEHIDLISIKYPWLNNKGKVQGIIVCDAIINLQNPGLLAEILHNIINLIDCTSVNVAANANVQALVEHFTKQEIEVIRWVIRGKTMREIADIACLSIRTVESYFETIKKKSNVRTKSEFIDKAINFYNL